MCQRYICRSEKQKHMKLHRATLEIILLVLSLNLLSSVIITFDC